MLDDDRRALARGESVSFTGFGKFSVAERGPRQGVNPRTGERITIAGGRVPKFSAGAALKSRVKGDRQGGPAQAARVRHRVSPAPFADRLAALVEERQSQLCLGLDPDPSRLDPRSAAAEGSAAERAAGGGRRALPLADRAGGPGLRRRQAPAGLLRAARARRVGRRSSAPWRRRARPGCW